jgi:hypothetical protein
MIFRTLRFSIVPGDFAVCRLAPDAPFPVWAVRRGIASVVRTPDELSVVCPMEDIQPGATVEGPWACIKLEGPFPFDQTGVLASVLDPLADAGIPIFALSTFDTDYVLVKTEQLEAATAALVRAGHQLLR